MKRASGSLSVQPQSVCTEMLSARDHEVCARMPCLTEVGSSRFLEHFVSSIISLNNIKRSFVDLLRKIVLGKVYRV